MAALMNTPAMETLEETVWFGPMAALYKKWCWLRPVAGGCEIGANPVVVRLAERQLMKAEEEIAAMPARTVYDMAAKIMIADSDGDGSMGDPVWEALVRDARDILKGAVA